MNNLLIGPLAILIGIAIALFVVLRQFQGRKVTPLNLLIAPALIGYFGLTSGGALSETNLLLLTANAALEIVLGLARGTTFRLWRNSTGEVIAQATRVTVGLWLVLIAVRVAMVFGERQLGLASDANSAAFLLPLALTLAAQNVLIWTRAQNMSLVTA